ncbi:hypothetical protein EXIGLDRAFT_697125 [Exidia glandulosa HHB12029]|uniref:Uncharacterized protein n=1 Tax=Exidia glandulosa HHB12029 TaxID=1314781 RepID=A0A165N1F4_EXIGL|nr:hypothetical protein EXIGLDRAFT_697125 [Exidia glandulosa HHB12029]
MSALPIPWLLIYKVVVNITQSEIHHCPKAPPKPKELPKPKMVPLPPMSMVEEWMSNVILPEFSCSRCCLLILDDLVLKPTEPTSSKTPFVFQLLLYSDGVLLLPLEHNSTSSSAGNGTRLREVELAGAWHALCVPLLGLLQIYIL